MTKAPGALPASVRTKPITTLPRAIALAIGLFALGVVAAGIWGGGRQALDVLRQMPLRVLPFMLALSLVNYAMRCLRWLWFSHALLLPVPRAVNAMIYVAGFSMTTTPGKVGEALRLYALRRRYGVAYERSAPLLVADRLADAMAMALVVSATVWWLARFAWIAILAVLLAVCLAVFVVRPHWIIGVLDLCYGRIRRWPRLFVRARRAVHAVQKLVSPPVFLPALALGVVGWCAEGFSLYLVLRGLGATMPPGLCLFIFGFAMLVGAATIVPGGLGGTEATMVGLLAAQHVDFAVALVATAVVRLTTLWFAVALGVCALPAALRAGRGAVAHV